MDPLSIAGLIIYWVAFGGMFAAVAPYTIGSDDDLAECAEVDQYTSLADSSSFLHAQPDEVDPEEVARLI